MGITKSQKVLTNELTKSYGNYLPTFKGRNLIKGINIKNLIIFSYLHPEPSSGKYMIMC